jgi:hypothetical protein
MTSQSSADVIELNVGGVIFASCRSTLTRISDSMLARLIDGNIPTAKDSQGRFGKYKYSDPRAFYAGLENF